MALRVREPYAPAALDWGMKATASWMSVSWGGQGAADRRGKVFHHAGGGCGDGGRVVGAVDGDGQVLEPVAPWLSLTV